MRQSIFPHEERDRLYDLFERYRAWRIEAKLFDASLLAHEWRPFAGPHYAFAVVDEVQDLTAAQLALVLKTLQQADQFVLCGDSNQIVHPNFFAWSRVKSLFWSDPELAGRQELHVLATNFRNGAEVTRVANALLKVKHRWFGSIDRESNFLVRTAGEVSGQAALLADTDGVKRELDAKIRQSTQFAVLVMREEDKAEARRHFSTPLIFSVQEAKGLEYGNIVLYRCVSGYRREFQEIAQGVSADDPAVESLEYARARDKSDKSLEIYKFFVNALYVGLTRAIENAYLIESDLEHPLLKLLGLTAGELSPDRAGLPARDRSIGERTTMPPTAAVAPRPDELLIVHWRGTTRALAPVRLVSQRIGTITRASVGPERLIQRADNVNGGRFSRSHPADSCQAARALSGPQRWPHLRSAAALGVARRQGRTRRRPDHRGPPEILPACVRAGRVPWPDRR